MDNHPRRTLFANSFGALGYIFCLILWAWTGILYVPVLLENEQIERIFIPPPDEPTTASQAPTMPSSMAIAFAVVITAIILVATIIVALRAPKVIAHSGKAVTTKAAASALPLITKGQKLSPAKKQRLTAGLVKLTKLLLVILPVAIGFFGVFIELPLPFDLSILVSSILAICALFWFSAQYITARLLSINLKLLI